MITHHCHECGIQVDEICSQHPNAQIDSISTPEPPQAIKPKRCPVCDEAQCETKSEGCGK